MFTTREQAFRCLRKKRPRVFRRAQSSITPAPPTSMLDIGRDAWPCRGGRFFRSAPTAPRSHDNIELGGAGELAPMRLKWRRAFFSQTPVPKKGHLGMPLRVGHRHVTGEGRPPRELLQKSRKGVRLGSFCKNRGGAPAPGTQQNSRRGVRSERGERRGEGEVTRGLREGGEIRRLPVANPIVNPTFQSHTQSQTQS